MKNYVWKDHNQIIRYSPIKLEVHKINKSAEKLDFVSTNENDTENKAQNLINNGK